MSFADKNLIQHFLGKGTEEKKHFKFFFQKALFIIISRKLKRYNGVIMKIRVITRKVVIRKQIIQFGKKI